MWHGTKTGARSAIFGELPETAFDAQSWLEVVEANEHIGSSGVV
tara:strand:+ start:285 stop:416 length:132 start_codon:yes stop_codon:yes gene_type:complete